MADGSSLRVLFVEDDAATLYALRRLSDYRGWDVRGARTGEEALEILLTFQPHVAVIDLGMQRMSGLALAREIRKVPMQCDIELVAHTGTTGEAVWQIARQEGFTLRVLKPDVPGELIAYLEARARSLALEDGLTGE